MIAFVVIGKNEESNLKRCFKSILNTVHKNSIFNYEIIYVDSDSTDKSIEIAEEFEQVKIIALKGKCNAAIGRNAGVKNSSSNILFFIDGDMEISSDFLPCILDTNTRLKYPFVSGQFENYYYTNDGKLISKSYYHKNVLNKDRYQTTTGGLFLITRELWNKVEGMDIRFRTGEDLDIGMRLTKMGYRLLRKKEVMAIHHTEDYKDSKRLWTDLVSGNSLYSRGLLYRKHFFSLYMIKRLAKSDPTSPLLFLTLLLSFSPFFIYAIVTYFIVLSFALIFFQKYERWYLFFERLPYHFIRDIFTLYSFFLFFPNRKEKVSYKAILKN